MDSYTAGTSHPLSCCFNSARMNRMKQIAPIVIAVMTMLMVASTAVAYALKSTDVPNIEVPLPFSPTETLQNNPAAIPLRLTIPSLSIDARIEPIGHTTAGNMASPSNFRDVAWFREGVRPGEAGAAVIAGHLDNALGLSGVFKKLHELREGDDVYVHTASGEDLRFRVMSTEEYPFDAVPVHELFQKEGGAYLNLITCAGKWIRDRKTYDRRLIVYTERIY